MWRGAYIVPAELVEAGNAALARVPERRARGCRAPERGLAAPRGARAGRAAAAERARAASSSTARCSPSAGRAARRPPSRRRRASPRRRSRRSRSSSCAARARAAVRGAGPGGPARPPFRARRRAGGPAKAGGRRGGRPLAPEAAVARLSSTSTPVALGGRPWPRARRPCATSLRRPWPRPAWAGQLRRRGPHGPTRSASARGPPRGGPP